MSTRRMLIDAAHPEEIRVVVSNNTEIEEFEYQTIKKSTKGNIYLAKVTRVEPSLQAAFVDYGNQKQGFLPFSEIHPDYYQIPTADREKLLEELAEARKKKSKSSERSAPKLSDEENDLLGEIIMPEAEDDQYDDDDDDYEEDILFYKRYKIQEVIKKDQVVLVQVEKEERGNKGASMTTFTSLAGRYCVFMPNATKGGGVSRKIDDGEDRSRLKKISSELTEQLDGRGAVIIRTAGAYKTKTEIKRDYSYLQKLWDNIREHTLGSKAPEFIHEESDVIKKSIRDLYHSEIEEVKVSGDKAYDDAREFMKLILPRHVNKIKKYSGKNPIFTQYRVDQQLSSLYDNHAPLKSGGYLVINHTEALVSIDVNSGRSTSERNVESTALKTNLEAADEVAKQLRLRDLSGLIVIDFIDMEELKNRKSIEKAFKKALSADRARVQIGRISTFGLLEMSRQRLRHSFFEANTEVCKCCNGRGRIRPLQATSVAALRAVSSELASAKADEIHMSGSSELVNYMLNNRRGHISEIEEKFDAKVILYTDESAGGDGFYLELKNSDGKAVEPKKALSNYDDMEYNEPVKSTSKAVSDDTDDDEEEKSESPSPKRKSNFKQNRRREKNPRSDRTSRSDRSERSPRSDREDRTDRGPKGKRPGRTGFHKSKEGNVHGGEQKRISKEVIMASEEEDDKFEEKMAERRVKNQSLLKEIWKKIVD